MQWKNLLSTRKFKVEDGRVSDYRSRNQGSNQSRSEYLQDHDRVVFSRAFRRWFGVSPRQWRREDSSLS